jgi:hypothetical protein
MSGQHDTPAVLPPAEKASVTLWYEAWRASASVDAVAKKIPSLPLPRMEPLLSRP